MYLMCMTTLPTKESAKAMIKLLLEQKLAACIQMVPIQSFYRWEGNVCEEEEYLLFIKTQKGCYEALQALIEKEHPYDVPELIGFSIEKGMQSYLSWIKQETIQS